MRRSLHIGSLALKVSPDRAANRGFLIDPQGEIAARYDKIHMFDVDLPNGESYRESRSYAPGEHAITADLPWGRLGLTICYDLRFPALYRALAEAGSMFLARRTGIRSTARAPSRTVASSSRQHKAAATRTAATRLGTRSSSTPGGACSPRATLTPPW
jgi:predicted amidohydrolase